MMPTPGFPLQKKRPNSSNANVQPGQPQKICSQGLLVVLLTVSSLEFNKLKAPMQAHVYPEQL